MSIEKKPDQNSKIPTDAELADQDLNAVTGGDGRLKLGNIKGEASDDKHKDTIYIESFRKP